jgi:ribonuclease-3
MYNSNAKRSSSSNHYGNERNKKQRPSNSSNPNFAPLTPQGRGGNQNGYGPSPQQDSKKYKNRDNPVLEHIDRLPEPAKCEPCKLASAEMQTGLIALLDKLVAEETTPHGDRDVLHHARELRQLLSDRVGETQSSKAQKALDEKRPLTAPNVQVPAYISQKMVQSKDLPKLPQITEPHLEEAVFTHITAHGVARVEGIYAADKLSYERLEFLGDAYIELIASRLIYSRLPTLSVPEQSTFREQLVKNETLGKFSSAYALPDRIKHGGHIQESKAWTKVIADVFEAYVAALVLSDPENGFQTAEKWLDELWAPQFLALKENVVENPQAKDDLSRLVACRGVVIRYNQERDGEVENGVQKYYMGVYLTGWGYENKWLGSGVARNKAQAGVQAAMDAISRKGAVLQAATEKKRELQQRLKEEAEAKEKEQSTDATVADPMEPTRAVKPAETAVESASAPHETNGSSYLEKQKKKMEKKEKKKKKEQMA